MGPALVVPTLLLWHRLAAEPSADTATVASLRLARLRVGEAMAFDADAPAAPLCPQLARLFVNETADAARGGAAARGAPMTALDHACVCFAILGALVTLATYARAARRVPRGRS